jgi:hypothetical protein
MASFLMRRVPGDGDQIKYKVEEDRLGRHLPRNPQRTAEDMMGLKPGIMDDYPSGMDFGPVMPGKQKRRLP